MKNTVTIKSNYVRFFNALSKVAMKRTNKTLDKDSNMTYIYFDKENSTFVSTNGKVILYVKIDDDEFTQNFNGTPFIEMISDSLLLATDTDYKGKTEYINYRKVIPRVKGNENYESYDLPSPAKFNRTLIGKKYLPFYFCEIISRESDNLLNPEFFDYVKELIFDFVTCYYGSFECEKIMPILLTSADETLTYVVMPIKEGE